MAVRIKIILCATLLAASFSFNLCIAGGSVAPQAEKKVVKLPILMYHEIKHFNQGKDVISPYEFESDLKYITKNYNTITMTQLIDYVYNAAPLPENPIVITFDDGYLNTYRYALPLIKEYKAHIVLSIVGKNTDDFTEIPDANLDYSHVTWDQLKEMLDSGYVEVQNHTYDMHSTGKGRIGCMQKDGESLQHYEEALSDDLRILQEKIQSHTGYIPNTFTVPYGRASENTEEIVKKLGFKASLTCRYGVNLITGDTETLYHLKRICRSHGRSAERELKDAFDTLNFPMRPKRSSSVASSMQSKSSSSTVSSEAQRSVSA